MNSATSMLLATLIAVTAYSQPQQVDFKSVDVDGGEMAYAEFGDPSGEPVILIQGSFVADAFLPLARTSELSDYRLILVNLRGYGRSSKVEAPFGIAEYAQDVEALIAALNVSSAHIVGHSYGTHIGLRLALDSPDKVETLTLIEPGACCNLREQFMGPLPPRDNSRSADSYTAEETRAAVDDRISRLFGGMETIAQIPGAYEQMLADIGGTFFGVQQNTPPWPFDPAEHLPGLEQPILFIYFNGGQPWHPNYSEMFREHHDASEVVSLEGSHHSFHVEQPQETAAVIAGFLKRNAMTSVESQGID